MDSTQNIIEKIFEQVESQLSSKLLRQGFQLQKQIISDEAFSSRYTEWIHQNDKQALRLVWDGKEGWFLIEESPFTENSKPNSWSDIIIIPFDKTSFNEDYIASVISDLVAEVN